MIKTTPKRRVSWSHTVRYHLTGKNGRPYRVTVNPNGMIGVEEVFSNGKLVHNKQPTRMRYADEIELWMRQSAKDADRKAFVPPQIAKAGTIPMPVEPPNVSNGEH